MTVSADSDVPSGRAGESETFRDRDGRLYVGWLTVATSLVGLALGPSVLQVMSLGVFTPYLREEFGWTLSEISIAAMILAIMMTAASVFQGVLVDRYGARRMILISIPLFGAGYCALALMTGPLWQFYLLWGLLPLLGVGIWPASYVKATSTWFDRRLGLAIAIATTGIGIGAALFPVPIHYLAATSGWRSAFVAVGLCSVAIAWPMAYLHLRDAAKSPVGQVAAMGQADVPPLRTSVLPLLLCAFLLLGIYSSAILLHLVSILEDAGTSRSTAVAAHSALGLMLIFGRLGCGLVIDNVSVRLVIPVLAIAAAIALLVLAVGAVGATAIAAAGVAGLLIGAEIDVLGFVVKRYFGMERYGRMYGLLFAAFQFGGAIGVLSLGMTRDRLGTYAPGLVGLAICCAAAAVLFTLLGPYRFRAQLNVRAREGDDIQARATAGKDSGIVWPIP